METKEERKAKCKQAELTNQEKKNIYLHKRETLKTRALTLKQKRKKPSPSDHVSCLSVYPVFPFLKAREMFL